MYIYTLCKEDSFTCLAKYLPPTSTSLREATTHISNRGLQEYGYGCKDVEVKKNIRVRWWVNCAHGSATIAVSVCENKNISYIL